MREGKKKQQDELGSKWFSETNETSINVIRQYCLDTGLHGLKYIAQRRNIGHQVFWSIAFGLGIAAGVYLIRGIYVQSKSNPVIFTFKASPANVERVPFPAITICGVNTVRKSDVEETIGLLETAWLGGLFVYLAVVFSVQQAHYFLHQICTTTSLSFSKKLNYTTETSHLLQQFEDALNKGDEKITSKNQSLQYTVTQARRMLSDFSQNCSEMILLCRWEDEERDCEELFQQSFTDYGYCCSFNMAPMHLLQIHENESEIYDENITKEWERLDLSIEALLLSHSDQNPPTYPRRSKRSGLSYGLSFLVNPEEDQYFCTSSDSAGFQFVSHLPIESPHMSEYGIGIPPDSEVFITLKSEITIADRAIEYLYPETRKCYLPGEQQLKYYLHYTYGNCIDECLANLTYFGCGCIRYYMTRDHDRGLCDPSKFECAENVRKNFGKEEKIGKCVNCLPTCTDISYHSEMTIRPMRRDANVWHDGENGTAEWVKKNVSIVHVYFGESKVYPKVRQRLYSIIDLIANTGGLLGLCLGFSVLSIVEFIYFLILEVIVKRISSILSRRANNVQSFEINSNINTTQIVKQSQDSETNSNERLFARRNNFFPGRPISPQLQLRQFGH